MSQKKVSAVIYAVLLLICAFALGYLAGFNHPSAEISVTMVAPNETAQCEMQAAITQPPAESGPVNLNTADQAQLEILPGIGPALAARIIAYRDAIGMFVSADQIKEVEGIGDKRYEEIKPFITVGGTP